MAPEPVVQAGGIAAPLVAANSATAPGAGSAFCTLSAPPAGTYKIKFAWALAGTAETALANVRVKLNGTNYLTPMMSLSGTGRMETVLENVTLDGLNAVQLVAVAAATAGAVYLGEIVAIRTG